MSGRAAFATLVGVLAAVAVPISGDTAEDVAWRAQFGIVAFDLNGAAPARLAALGIGLIRGSCGWSELEPARGIYDWRCADAVIAGAQQRRLRSYMTVNCTPGWAGGAKACEGLPSDFTDWYDFVQQFVARYSAFDTMLGVWNEPNLTLPDDPSGDGYALLFVNASAARNRVNPGFVLAGPDTSHHALADGYYARVMDRIAQMHAWNPRDAVAVHWYPDGPPLVDYMDAIRSSAGSQEVWLTETGFSSPDDQQQAAFYDNTIVTFLGARRPWWTHIVFYRLWDGQDCCTDAILRGDFGPKPAYTTLREWLMSPDGRPRSAPRRGES